MSDMVIRPIIPFIFDSGVTLDSKFFLLASLMACLAAVAALALAGYCSERYETDRKKTALMSAIIAVSVTLIMICFFGCSATAVKGIILLSVLALSSFEDIRTRECDDYLHVLIAVAAFIGTDIKRLPEMILAGFFAGGIIVLSKLIGKGKIGGADIKLAAARDLWSARRDGSCGHRESFEEKQEIGIPDDPVSGCRFLGGIPDDRLRRRKSEDRYLQIHKIQ